MPSFVSIVNASAAILMTVVPPMYWNNIHQAKNEILTSYGTVQARAEQMITNGDYAAMNDLVNQIGVYQKDLDALMPIAEALAHQGYVREIPEIK